jgi:hypothetical protein
MTPQEVKKVPFDPLAGKRHTPVFMVRNIIIDRMANKRAGRL